jgi:alkaline phosphatase D
MQTSYLRSCLGATLIFTLLIATEEGQAADSNTFELGIASGEVTSNQAVLWARTDEPGTVRLEVSTDPNLQGKHVFQDNVRSSETDDMTVRVLVEGLEPGTTYFYQWRRGNDESAIGTFKTAPLPDSAQSLRFTFSGDTDATKINGVPAYNNFEALQAAANEPNDFFLYVGDTIYSDSIRRASPAVTLPEYREAYQEARGYSSLQNLLQSTSIYSIWDDHEVIDDYSGQNVDASRYGTGRQAFFEYMPMFDSGLPQDGTCAGSPLFRRFKWGSQAEIMVLDDRSCRSDLAIEACSILGIPDPAPTLPADQRVQLGFPPFTVPGCLETIWDPARTMLGSVQKALFKDALLNSTAKFKIVVTPLPIQQFFALPYDRWEGFAAERAEIINFIKNNAIQNVIFLSTDAHANLINEVFVDRFTDPQSVGFEFVAGPVATDTLEDNIAAMFGPPGVTFLNSLITRAGVDCRDLDAFSYGTVEIDSTTGTAAITLKSDSGAILADTVDPTIQCTKTVGP